MSKKILSDVSLVSNWTSVAGALEGALRALGVPHDRATVMGLSGHAFRLSIHTSEEGIADGASAASFDYERATRLYANLGYRVDQIGTRPGDRDYQRRREEAIKRMRRSIDHGLPVIAYDLHLPEFGLVKGYDDRAGLLYVSTAVSAQYGEVLPLSQWPVPGHLRWVQVILLGERRRVEARDAEQEALRFAIEQAEAGDPRLPPDTRQGFAAYEHWLTGYATPGQLAAAGNAHAIQALQAARHDAARFLRDIARDYPAAVAAGLKQSATAYDAEVLACSRLASLFPYPAGGDVRGEGVLNAGRAALSQAYDHEREAIAQIRGALRFRG